MSEPDTSTIGEQIAEDWACGRLTGTVAEAIDAALLAAVPRFAKQDEVLDILAQGFRNSVATHDASLVTGLQNAHRALMRAGYRIINGERI